MYEHHIHLFVKQFPKLVQTMTRGHTHYAHTHFITTNVTQAQFVIHIVKTTLP